MSAEVAKPQRYQSLLEYGQAVLNTHDSNDKCDLTYEAWDLWHNHNLPLGDQENPPVVPDHPARPNNVQIVSTRDMVGHVRGDQHGNHLRLIHSQAHIESYAIDLSWDILVRFAGFKCDDGSLLPRDYFADWLKVAHDEARHFQLWDCRLKDLGSEYGAYPTHDTLWDSAFATKDNLLARISIIHLVAEAHGLDCAARLFSQFLGHRDKLSAGYLKEIEEDEVTHVAAGFRWFNYITQRNGVEKPIPLFHDLVKQYFAGTPRPPFSIEQRAKAGLTPEWYEPLQEIRRDPTQGKLSIKEILAQRKEKKNATANQNENVDEDKKTDNSNNNNNQEDTQKQDESLPKDQEQAKPE